MSSIQLQKQYAVQNQPVVENTQPNNLYRVNFRANEKPDSFEKETNFKANNNVVYQDDPLTLAIRKREQEQKKQKIKQNLITAVSVGSGLAIIATALLSIKFLRKGGGVGGFDIGNLKFQNFKNDSGIADLKSTKTLSKKVQEFFVDMLEASGIDEKYIQRAGLKDKGFPNCGLLLGPSGTGKTESVKMFAKANDSELVVIKLGDFANSYVNGTATNMTKMFEQLDALFKKNPNKKYTILFDEADGIAKKLVNISADKQYLNENRQAFLTGCDIIMPNKNVKVFAATNIALKEMDEAVISRFGKNIEFNLPEANQLIEGMKFHLKDCKGLTDEKGFDFFKDKTAEINQVVQEMIDKKYAFRDLQKMITDAQAIYAKDMNTQKKELLFDIKYIKDAMSKKGQTAGEIM